MPVGNESWPHIYPIKGLRLSAASAGIRYQNRDDVVLMCADEGSVIAGVFTQNAFAAAPVIIAKNHLLTDKALALIINSGNANACTGEQGLDASLQTCRAVAEHLNENEKGRSLIKASQVLPFSTGVIGEALPYEKINASLSELKNSLSESQESWSNAAKAIMTTDTRAKGASEKIDLDSHTVHVTGIAKGSGMINPNMGTMLAYIATDANVSPELIGSLSKVAADKSFNRITIDGDTSTNDAAVLIATGKAGNVEISEESSDAFQKLKESVIRVYQSLAKQIVQDGEGATKCVDIRVDGGHTSQECFDVAYAIAHSPLVKTALFASDPNWGRIVAAIGYSGVDDLDANLVDVYLDNVQIVDKGTRAQSYTEESGQQVLDKEEFSIRVHLNRGGFSESLWTSDLSHEYIRINAEYRS